MHEGQENKTLPESWPGRQLVVQVGIDGHPLDDVALAGREESALGPSDKRSTIVTSPPESHARSQAVL